jgi:hypothetical protein
LQNKKTHTIFAAGTHKISEQKEKQKDDTPSTYRPPNPHDSRRAAFFLFIFKNR